MKKTLCFVMAILSITVMITFQSCDKCRDTNCQNGGTCDDGICDCPPGYSGANCEIEPCTYVQWTGTGSCQSGYYPVSNTGCCPDGFPYSSGGGCYTTCQGAAANGATVYRYNDGTGGGGGGGGGGSCTYVQWTGTANCNPGYYPRIGNLCSQSPFSFSGSPGSYATCEAATQAANGATVYRYNDGTGGGGGGGGTCTYVQWTGTDNCQSGYYPVSNTSCCPTGSPYFFGTSCYATCEAATQAANGATVYRYNDGTGGGGGGGGGTAGYNCVSGSCQSVNSNAQYSTLSACQNQCGGGGPLEIVNTCVSGGTYDRQYVSFTVPTGVTFMEVRTSEVSPCTYNATDLFVRKGSQPITNNNGTSYTADCVSDNVNRQQELCQFTNPQPGTWWVMLYNSNGGNHYESKLVVTITQ